MLVCWTWVSFYYHPLFFLHAEIMKNGGICGMPTDTVYVLVAACNRPDAVIKAYKSVSYFMYFTCP